MKKLLLSFLLLPFVYISQAQDAKASKEETLNYIKAKFATSSHLYEINETSLMYANSYQRKTNGDRIPIDVVFIKYNDITDIQYIMSDDYWLINLAGEAVLYRDTTHHDYNKALNNTASIIMHNNQSLGKQSGGQKFQIGFRSTVPEAEIKKYVKALKQMATLHNAKLIKDDLFGN